MTAETQEINSEDTLNDESQEDLKSKGILDAIKGERRLTLNHWRYKMLHWCVGSKQGEKCKELPYFLYSHYCPLFHLTNTIVIFSPLILLSKVLFAIARPIAACIEDLCAAYKERLKEVEKSNQEQSKVNNPTSSYRAKKESVKTIIKLLGSFSPDCGFDYFWEEKQHRFDLSKEDVKIEFDRVAPKYWASKKAAEERQVRIRNRIIFWANFSRGFIKSALNIIYVSLFLGVAYFVVAYVIPLAFQFIMWLFTIDLIPILLISLKISICIGLAAGLIYLMSKFKVAQKCGQGICVGFKKAIYPFKLIGKIIASTIDYVFSLIDFVVEFCSVFYEENCPPISIIDEETAEIEAESGK